MNAVLGPLTRLFATSSPDRGTPMALLDSLSEHADKPYKKAASGKIWSNLVCWSALVFLRVDPGGFTDTVVPFPLECKSLHTCC